MPRSDRERIEELEETIRQLREVFAPTLILPPAWGMQRACRLLLQALLSRPIISPAHYRVYVNGRPGRDDTRNLTVTIYRIRKVLEPKGIQIQNIPAVGYTMSDKDKAKLRKLIRR